MIIVRIKCGLGNQLFQYAAAYALSKRLNQPFLLYFGASDRPFRLNQLNVFVKTLIPEENLPHEFTIMKNRYVNDSLSKLGITQHLFGKWLYFRERGEECLEEFLAINEKNENIYMDGYFQSDECFKQYRNDLLRQFQPSYPAEASYVQALEQIKGCNSVAVHVRRGDFLASPHPFHYQLPADYYRRAITYMRERLETPIFFWFSEDYEWIYGNFDIEKDFRFVKIKTANGDIDDMMLMRNCNHIITANSTFSWWGAWLNENENGICVVPEKPFGIRQMIPDSWIKFPVE